MKPKTVEHCNWKCNLYVGYVWLLTEMWFDSFRTCWLVQTDWPGRQWGAQVRKSVSPCVIISTGATRNKIHIFSFSVIFKLLLRWNYRRCCRRDKLTWTAEKMIYLTAGFEFLLNCHHHHLSSWYIHLFPGRNSPPRTSSLSSWRTSDDSDPVLLSISESRGYNRQGCVTTLSSPFCIHSTHAQHT